MTPEGKVKDAVKRVLNEFGVYYHMPVQNGMGKPSLDFVCCVNGHFLAIETKADEKSAPTLRQQATIAEIRKANGMAIVIRGLCDAEGFGMLRAFLELGQ